MYRSDIQAVRISLPFYDRLIVFTSCDQLEISETKRILKAEIGVRSKNLFWKANFESDDDWRNNGWLQLMNETFYFYEKTLEKNRNGQNSNVNLKNIQSLKSRTYQRISEEQCMSRKSMVVKPVFGEIDYLAEKDFVFVLMPFTESWSDDVYHLIKSVGEDLRINIKRASDFFEPNVIMQDVWTSINRASLLIADISVHNANVFLRTGNCPHAG